MNAHSMHAQQGLVGTDAPELCRAQHPAPTNTTRKGTRLANEVVNFPSQFLGKEGHSPAPESARFEKYVHFCHSTHFFVREVQ